MRRFFLRSAVLGAAVVSPFASRSFAQSVADAVVTYNPVNAPLTFGGTPYNVSSGALGMLTADTTFGDLTPFNGAFDLNQITGVGDGGSLILHMSQPISTAGVTLGVHSAAGLIESPFGSGDTTNPALDYTDPRTATISVSKDGNSWVSLGSHQFDNPSNYYAQGVTTPDHDTTAGTPANFFQPFTGSLSDFSGKDWPGVESVLNGSAGGDWFNLSGTGLSEVNYVKFEVGSGNEMFVDAVVGIAVPEPVILAPMALLFLARRRR